MSTMKPLVSKAFFTYLCLDSLRYTKVVCFCVYLSFLSPVFALENVALRKPARQSNTFTAYPYATADKAVDGNTEGDFYHYSCTHSSDSINTWWKVDLMGLYNITSVQLFTRTDACPYRLKNFEVRVSDLDPTTFPSGEGQQCIFFTQQVANRGTSLTCSRPITGRFVSVFKAADDVLTICEIFVLGTKLDLSGMYKLVQDNSRFNASVLTSLTTPSLIGCAVKCLSDVMCLAFNVMLSATRAPGGVTCELLGPTEWVTNMTLQAQTGWRAYKRLVE